MTVVRLIRLIHRSQASSTRSIVLTVCETESMPAVQLTFTLDLKLQVLPRRKPRQVWCLQA